MNSKEIRDRKYAIMKARLRPTQPYDHYQERHLQQAREIADRHHQHIQMHTLELLVQARKSSNVLEELVSIVIDQQKKGASND